MMYECAKQTQNTVNIYVRIINDDDDDDESDLQWWWYVFSITNLTELCLSFK